MTQRLRKAGLDKIFTYETLGSRRAVYISSVTDVEMKKKKSYAEKDREVLVRVGADPEEMVAWVSELGIGHGRCDGSVHGGESQHQQVRILFVQTRH